MAGAKPLLIGAVLALVLAGAALADHPIIRFNAANKAAARATVRTELTLTVTAAGRSPTAVHALEVQLARLLVSRVHT